MLSQQRKEDSLMWMIESHLGTASRAEIVPIAWTRSLTVTSSFVLCVFSLTHTQALRSFAGMVMRLPFGRSFHLISVALEGKLEGFYV